MGNPRSIFPAWLNKLLAAKPTIQPRCTCGRFCSTHAEVPDTKGMLIRSLTAQGAYVPPRLRPTREGGAS